MRLRARAIIIVRMNTTTTTTDPKIQTVQRLYEAVGTGDIDTILQLLTDDVDWAAEAASNSAPWYGSYRGRSAVPGFFGALASTIDITEFTPHSFTSSDTEVMNAVTFRWTARATGKKVAMTMQHHWRFDGDRISYFRGAEDTEQSVAALS